jgi:hypothetical protein
MRPGFVSEVVPVNSSSLYFGQAFHPDPSEAQWSDLLFDPSWQLQHMKALPYDLSSRPKRSEVEGPAVLSTLMRACSK